MTFIIGWGFAERQILKKVKMALSLELSGIWLIDLCVNIDIIKI